MDFAEKFATASKSSNNFNWNKIYSNGIKLQPLFPNVKFGSSTSEKKDVRKNLRDRELLTEFFKKFENTKLSDEDKKELKKYINLMCEDISELKKICDNKVIEKITKVIA